MRFTDCMWLSKGRWPTWQPARAESRLSFVAGLRNRDGWWCWGSHNPNAAAAKPLSAFVKGNSDGAATATCVAFLMIALLLPAFAQEKPVQPPAAGGAASSQMANANNPLANLNALNFQNYWGPSLYGVPDAGVNTMNLRPVIVSGRQIVRATLPISTVPVGQNQYRSGLGDFSIFDAIKLTPEGAATDFAVGPLLVAPTATDSALGAGKWQIGVAAVAIHPMPGGSLVGGLVTWQTDFAGDVDRARTNLATIQPIATFSVGGGYYVRSTAVSIFDFERDNYLIPFGLGFGKVFKAGSAIANAFVEPQFSVYHKGAGLPSFQLLVGLNLQWAKK